MPRKRSREPPRADDEIVFHAAWEPARIAASLDHLIYNGDLIDDAEPEYAPGRLTLTFQRPGHPVHRFQWSALFVGKKLRNLEAGASVNGIESALSSAGAAENRWAGEGDWKAPGS
jgi:hypothetical protein